MSEKRFIFIDVGNPSREQIKEQLLNGKSLISDECAFLRHLVRSGMMSEKRFTMKYSYEDEEYVIYDDGNPLTPSRVVKKLNEQQATITKQEKQIAKLEDNVAELMTHLIINGFEVEIEKDGKRINVNEMIDDE